VNRLDIGSVQPAPSRGFWLRRAPRSFLLPRIEAYFQLGEGDDDAVLAELMKDGRMQFVQEHQSSILVQAEDPELEKHRAVCKLHEQHFRGRHFQDVRIRVRDFQQDAPHQVDKCR
jgi:hypothetical protein